MSNLGYALSSEEHIPNDLVRHAQHAEQVGFSFALISDHYHPIAPFSVETASTHEADATIRSIES